MNRYFFILLFYLSLNIVCYGQNIIVKGSVFQSESIALKRDIRLSLNDTLANLIKNNDEKTLKKFYKKKSNWKKYIITPNKNGQFKIKAGLKDSITFRANQHYTKKFSVSDLIKLDSIHIRLDAKPCDDDPCNEKSKLIILKGQKVKFEKGNYNYCNTISMNSEWAASYSIDFLIYGDYENEMIDFKVSVHARQPSVQKSKNVVLYINNSCGKFVLTRNGYDPVFKTKNGKWATNYQSFYLSKIPEKLRPKPEKIEFIEPVIINFHESWDENYISERWFEPYYTIQGRTAIANYGFYLEDAVKIRLAYLNKFYETLSD